MTLTQPPRARTAVSRRGAARQGTWDQIAALARDSRVPAAAFVVHLALVLAIDAVAMKWSAALPAVPAVGYYLQPMTGLAHYLLEPLRNWDGFWYTLIAERGYGVHPATAAFWPLYPVILRFGQAFTGWSVPIFGILFSNVTFLVALVALYRLIRLDYGEKVSRRALWLLVLFPTTYYFSAVYTESLFLLLTVAAIYFGRTNRWGRAAIAGALAALTRNTGALVLIPLVILLVQQHGWNPRRWWTIIAQLSIVALAPLVFLWHLDQVWGDPLLTIHVQSEWARYQAMPWMTMRDAFRQLDLSWLRQIIADPSWSTVTSTYVRWRFAVGQSYDIFITLLFIPITLYTLVKVRPAYSIYTAVVFVLPLFTPSHVHPLMSIPRFVIVLFPFFIALAILLRNRLLYAVVLGLSVVQFVALLMQFGRWFWVA